ncbi:Hypothetical protein FKW44_000961, partial [Caligus rogercresseyi]
MVLRAGSSMDATDTSGFGFRGGYLLNPLIVETLPRIASWSKVKEESIVIWTWIWRRKF